MGGESREERRSRELIELLNELRVALPGVQVLFAFLLAVPFTQRWEAVTELQRNVFFAAVLAATLATALLIAPSAYHRIQWRERDEEQMLRTSNLLAIGGTLFLAVAMTCVVFVITDLIYGSGLVAGVTAATALTFGMLWFGLPLSRRLRG